MKKVLAIDGNSILNRAFYGIKLLSSRKGVYTNAVYGMVNIVTKQIEQLAPDYCAVAFDVRKPTFRHKMYDEYKAGRHETPPELLMQFPIAKQCMEALGLVTVELEGYEADDILGTVAALAGREEDCHAYLLTGDRDSLQLISDHTTVLLATNQDTLNFDSAAFREKYGVDSSQFVDVKALMGDSSDHIPGVAGIGEKTALKLISEFGSLDALYEALPAKSLTALTNQKLQDGKESAYLSRRLSRIVTDVPVPASLEDIAYRGVDKARAYEIFTELEFSAFVKRFALEEQTKTCGVAAEEAEIASVDADALREALADTERVAVLMTENGLMFSDGCRYFEYTAEISDVSDILMSDKHKFICYDCKSLYKALSADGVDFRGAYHDVMLGAYVLNPAESSFSFERLCAAYLGISAEHEDIRYLFALYEAISEKIEQNGQQDLLYRIEMPLAAVLADMEICGCCVDMDGLKDYGRFSGYGDEPPEKNGDFAWLLHILKSLKTTGKAAVILPHGVLFRGNAEATIRKAIIDKGYIKGIIGLPANLFYGTGIPACIIVIDKSDADEREGIFMIDASHDYVKDGNKNRLREQDIYKIVTTFNEQITTDPKYARFVPNEEIKVKNDYNLNIPRYIDSSASEDLQDIDAHLHGGIPAADVDSMEKYWSLFPKLKEKLFSPLREGYYQLNIDKDDVRSTVYADEEFCAYADRIDMAFDAWMSDVDDGLRNIDEFVELKPYIVELSEILIAKYADIELVDKYDVYQVLLSYWQDVMADDVFVLAQDGYEAGRETEDIYEITEDKKTKQEKKKYKGWEGKLIPKALIETVYFVAECKEIDTTQALVDENQSLLDELIEEQSSEDGVLSDCLNDKGTVDNKAVNAKIKLLKKTDPDSDEYDILIKYTVLSDLVKDLVAKVKKLTAELDEKCRAKYDDLTLDEIKELLVNRKWYYTIFDGIKALYVTTSHEIAGRIAELAERYEDTLPSLENDVVTYEAKVKAHLERMGFVW